MAAGRALADFDGGNVVVGVTSTPFKCPPAPSETALLVHDHLTARGLRDRSTISLVMPLPAPIPPSPPASKAVLEAFAERGIEFVPGALVTGLDAGRGVAVIADGREIPYDLFLGVPKHQVPAVVAESGHGRGRLDPRRPADVGDVVPRRLRRRRRHQRRHAEGGGVRRGPGGGRRPADHRPGPRRGAAATYGGVGVCYLEFGDHRVATVTVTFLQGQAPVGTMAGPSAELAADKVEFGRSRVARWF